MKSPKTNYMIIHPGEILKEDFIEDMNITVSILANEIGVEVDLINQIIEGKEGISEDMAFRLSKYYKTSVELWLNLQKNYELRKAGLKFK